MQLIGERLIMKMRCNIIIVFGEHAAASVFKAAALWNTEEDTCQYVFTLHQRARELLNEYACDIWHHSFWRNDVLLHALGGAFCSTRRPLNRDSQWCAYIILYWAYFLQARSDDYRRAAVALEMPATFADDSARAWADRRCAARLWCLI